MTKRADQSRQTSRPVSKRASQRPGRARLGDGGLAGGNLKYRVFLSYARGDQVSAMRVLEHLRGIGVMPCSDLDIPGGEPFDAEIRKLISHCHVFVSLLTRTSQKSAWVLQELGYAMGLGIPVLPLALAPEALPKGMADRVQAKNVGPDLENLTGELSFKQVAGMVRNRRPSLAATYECADGLAERTRMLVEYARELCGSKWPARVRQRVAFSSFGIPDRSPDDPIWDRREGTEKRSREVRELLRQERELMETLARRGGCDLILDPWVTTARASSSSRRRDLKHAAVATLTRASLLIDFIRSMPTSKLNVALTPGRVDEGTIILGDWVTSTAVVPHYKGHGYRKTLFTRHAPTIVSSTAEFDRRFAEGLEAMRKRHRDGSTATASTLALRELSKLRDQLGKR